MSHRNAAMKLIFDVGAHRGEDTDFYLRKSFKVVAVEANPTLARQLRDRFRDAIDRGQLVVAERAIAEQDGEVSFFVNESSVWGTIRSEWAERNQKMGLSNTRISVPSVRFDALLKEHGVPYYLKIDIEGADMLCIRALEQSPTRPQFVSIESNKTSWRDLVGEFDALQALGYNRFKVVNQNRVTAHREPEPALEGTYAGHKFPPGSTGLFGTELPGRWLTRRGALLKYAFIFLQYRLFGDNTRGERIVRRRLPAALQRLLIPDWYDTHATAL
jgi:FkbM family methyltransferase